MKPILIFGVPHFIGAFYITSLHSKRFLRGPSPTRILTSLAYSLVAAAEPSSVSQPGWAGRFCMGSLGILESFVTRLMGSLQIGQQINGVSLQGEIHPRNKRSYFTFIYHIYNIVITWFLGHFEGMFCHREMSPKSGKWKNTSPTFHDLK